MAETVRVIFILLLGLFVGVFSPYFSLGGGERVAISCHYGSTVISLPNGAVISVVSTGGHPAAPPEQCGAGGVSLEGEAGAIASRTKRGMDSGLARDKLQNAESLK